MAAAVINRAVPPIVSGVCATMAGIGLSRFAYAPLVPALVQAGVLSGGAAGALGALNLGGYLVGAAIAPSLGRACGLRVTLRAAMLLVTLSFLLCAAATGLWSLAPWRVLTGLAAGVLMVLAGPAVQAVMPQSMRGLAAGLVFAGVGSGIVVGALMVPALLPAGIAAVWLALAAVSAGLAALSWGIWPDVPAPALIRLPRLSGATLALVVGYSFAAMGQVVHMVWWPDFIARGLGHSSGGAAVFWLLYGASAAIGPTIYGRLADRIGAARGIQVGTAIQALALGLPLLATSTAALAVSALLAGGTAIGLTALALTRARELGGAAGPGIWRLSTAAFGMAQTITGFFLAWLYTATGGHEALFALGLAASLAALATSFVTR